MRVDFSVPEGFAIAGRRDFKTIILEGWWLKETHVPVYPGQHTVSAHFLDCSYQWVLKDRRRQFVLATGTTYPS